MPDLSAGRPLLYSKSDHEAFAAAVADALGPYVQVDEFNLASTLLDFLAAAGRLLPASSEHREVWRIVGNGWAWDLIESSEDDARARLDESGRTGQLMRRSWFAGPWTEVDPDA